MDSNQGIKGGENNLADKENVITISHVSKSFHGNNVVKDLNLQVKSGEFLTLLGPSGCGKTTTLRMIAGFDTPTSGQILLSGQNVKSLEPYEREVNTVFQNYALFPYMTVYDNVAFGLTLKKVPKPEIKKRVMYILSLVQLEGYENRKPEQLSGGQKQRVAIARALVNRPKVLLLDEPLGALDLKLRKQMQFELKRLQKKIGITFIYVTHDQEEAMTMSDRIAILYNGILQQVDVPCNIYNRPLSKFVADFIGESNIFYGYVSEENGQQKTVVLENGEVTICDSTVLPKQILYVSVRPEDMQLSKEPQHGFTIFGHVKDVIFVGAVIKTIIDLPEKMEIKVNSSPRKAVFHVGDKVYLSWEPENAVVIPTTDQKIYQIIERAESVACPGKELCHS